MPTFGHLIPHVDLTCRNRRMVGLQRLGYPVRYHHRHPSPALPDAFTCLGPTTTLRYLRGRGVYGRSCAATRFKRFYALLVATRGFPCPFAWLFACPVLCCMQRCLTVPRRHTATPQLAVSLHGYKTRIRTYTRGTAQQTQHFPLYSCSGYVYLYAGCAFYSIVSSAPDAPYLAWTAGSRSLVPRTAVQRIPLLHLPMTRFWLCAGLT